MRAPAAIVEAWKRGWSRAEKKVVMGDGAEWIWNIAEQHFPGEPNPFGFALSV